MIKSAEANSSFGLVNADAKIVLSKMLYRCDSCTIGSQDSESRVRKTSDQKLTWFRRFSNVTHSRKQWTEIESWKFASLLPFDNMRDVWPGASFLGFDNMRDVTLVLLFFPLITCGMLRWCFFSWLWQHAGCYAGASFLGIGNMRDCKNEDEK